MRLLKRLLNGGLACSLVAVLVTGCGGVDDRSGGTATEVDALVAGEFAADSLPVMESELEYEASFDLGPIDSTQLYNFTALPMMSYSAGFGSRSAENSAVFAQDGEQDKPGNRVVLGRYRPSRLPVSAEPEATAALPEFVNAHNRLAIKLFDAFSVGETDNLGINREKNSVLPPFAVSQVMGMVASGAADETLKEFQNIYSRDGGDTWLRDSSYLLSQPATSADSKAFRGRNALFGHTGYLFLPNYLEVLAGYYQARLTALDFSGRGSDYQAAVDGWINKITSGRIGYIGHDHDPVKTRWIAARAERFNARWDTPFNPDKVFSGLFQKLDDRQYRVPMVRRRGVFNAYQDETVSVVEMPLAANRYSLVVFMPNGPLRTRQYDEALCNSIYHEDGTVEIIKDDSCYRTVNQDQYFYQFKNSFLEKYQLLVDLLSPQSIEVKLPTFSIDSNNYALADFLQSNGVALAFAEKQADFSGVNGLGYAYLKDFRQSAMLGLTAKGLQGAGAVVAASEATWNEPPRVWANGVYDFMCSAAIFYFGQPLPLPEAVPDARPFLFVVRDMRTKAILYIGSLVDPGGILVN